MDIETSYDNEIRFFDACMAAVKTLTELAQKALEEGDTTSAFGDHAVIEDADDACVGYIRVEP